MNGLLGSLSRVGSNLVEFMNIVKSTVICGILASNAGLIEYIGSCNEQDSERRLDIENLVLVAENSM